MLNKEAEFDAMPKSAGKIKYSKTVERGHASRATAKKGKGK
jgi:hypothetical protein